MIRTTGSSSGGQDMARGVRGVGWEQERKLKIENFNATRELSHLRSHDTRNAQTRLMTLVNQPLALALADQPCPFQ